MRGILAYLCRLRPMRTTRSLVLVAEAILQMDLEDDPRLWGYALSKRSGVRSGVLYPMLDRMLQEAWIEDAWEERAEGWKRPPRRYYRLTDDGRTQLGAVVQRAGREQSFTGLRVGFA